MNSLNINALVGMNVFGYQICWQPREVGAQLVEPYTPTPPYYLNETEKKMFTGVHYIPNYFLDLEHSLQIIEGMNIRGFDFQMNRTIHDAGWKAVFKTSGEDATSSTQDLPSMAICLAALKCFGVNPELPIEEVLPASHPQIDKREVRIFSRSIFRKLKERGHTNQHIVQLSTELLGLVVDCIRGKK